MDNLLPVGVKKAWNELIGLLERGGRKLLDVDKGGLLFHLYCSSSAAVDDLNELIKTGSIKEALTTFLSTVGISVSITKTTLLHKPVYWTECPTKD